MKAFNQTFGKTFGRPFSQFLPSDLPGLRSWFMASEGVTLVSGDVSGWADQSGHGNDAAQTTAGNRPLFVADAFNGHPVLRFDGVNNYLSLDMSFLAGSDFSIYTAIQRNSDASTSYYCPGGAAGNFVGPHIGWRTDTTYTLAFTGAAVNETIPAFTTTKPLVVGNRFSQTFGFNVCYYEDGVLHSMTGANTTPLTSVLNGEIGRSLNNNGTALDGDIAEIFFFDRRMSDAEDAMMAGYLGNKYVIPLGVLGTIHLRTVEPEEEAAHGI